VECRNLLDSLELKAFMDGVMLTHLRDKHIAGAAISIIKDGKTLLASGYGFSDVTARHPVSADSSLFASAPFPKCLSG